MPRLKSIQVIAAGSADNALQFAPAVPQQSMNATCINMYRDAGLSAGYKDEDSF